MVEVDVLLQKVRRRLRPANVAHALKRQMMAHPVSRELSVSVVQRFLPQREVAGSTRLPDLSVGPAAAALGRDGFVELGKFLSDEDVDSLLAYTSTLRCFDPWATPAQSHERFFHREAPPSCHTAHFEKADLCRSPLIMSIANDRVVLSIARRFLGATPTISNVAMWWSYAGRAAPLEAQRFHRDYDDLKFCKVMIYLTDVDEESGPHVYVRGSAQRRGLTHTAGVALRYEDELVMRQFGAESITRFCEPRGHAFLIDPFGVHKGLLPISNDRLVLQVVYSLFPTGYDPYPESARAPRHGNWDEYVNRLNFR